MEENRYAASQHGVKSRPPRVGITLGLQAEQRALEHLHDCARGMALALSKVTLQQFTNT